jgi:hypothetical protein
MSRFTKMRDRDADELENNIHEGVAEAKRAGLDFYKILAGVDAYFEKRRRKDGVGSYGAIPETLPVDPTSPAWGGEQGSETLG